MIGGTKTIRNLIFKKESNEIKVRVMDLFGLGIAIFIFSSLAKVMNGFVK